MKHILAILMVASLGANAVEMTVSVDDFDDVSVKSCSDTILLSAKPTQWVITKNTSEKYQLELYTKLDEPIKELVFKIDGEFLSLTKLGPIYQDGYLLSEMTSDQLTKIALGNDVNIRVRTYSHNRIDGTSPKDIVDCALQL